MGAVSGYVYFSVRALTSFSAGRRGASTERKGGRESEQEREKREKEEKGEERNRKTVKKA